MAEVEDGSTAPVMASGMEGDAALEETAKDTLQFFEDVAAHAEAQLRTHTDPTVNSLANLNSLTTGRAIAELARIGNERVQDLLRLRAEPAIARIVALDEADQPVTVFITRAVPPPGIRSGDTMVASYRAPMGRLAAIRVGQEEEVRTPRAIRSFLVQERAALRPTHDNDGWDSRNTTIWRENLSPVTVISLRALIARSVPLSDAETDLLDRVLEEDSAAANIRAGIQRSVLQKIALRDQPLLDQYQDEIFRLPLDTRLVILGPPGTGKTTTLLKRLGQKVDPEYLEEDEKASVANSNAGIGGHQQSWQMFTPTELLKQYVKEAFAREGIPASDLRIQHWSDYRHQISRSHLGVLRTATGPGFVLRENLPSLQSTASHQPVAWYEDFQRWQIDSYWKALAEKADVLAASNDSQMASLGRRLLQIVSPSPSGLGAGPFLALERTSAEVAGIINSTRSEVDEILKEAFTRELRIDNGLLDALLQQIKEHGNMGSEDEVEDGSEDYDDREETSTNQRGKKREAFDAYKRAIRALSRAVATNSVVSRGSLNHRILDWLGNRTPTPTQQLRMGKRLITESALRHFSNSLRRYLSGVPARYRRFRQQRRNDGIWYTHEQFRSDEIAPLELDVIVLSMLRIARGLLSDHRMIPSIDDPRYGALASVRQLFRNQILVDEATDFSPIQLACMRSLCDPAIDSFLACGDFNQRITDWGSRSLDDLKWVSADFDIRIINTTYRHSAQLNQLAHELVAIAGDPSTVAVLPPDVNNEAVLPVLGCSLSGALVAPWLSERIREIERFTGTLPSIAILVDEEDSVMPLAEQLNAALESQNLRVVGCPNGQVVGQDSNVRVFNAAHIKGLEFEAVFFVGIDELATSQPELFDKFLYVGATRAATYLGLTCSGPDLPPRIAPLARLFASSW